MTREEAIKCLKSIQGWIPDWDDREDGLDYWDAIEMAISALTPPTQEQMERVWTHCEHCADGKSVDGQIILCGNRGLFSMNFCPICGAPLRDKAWEEMMERLEALNDAD